MDFSIQRLLEFLIVTTFSRIGESDIPVTPVDIKMISQLCPKQVNKTMDINLVEKIRYHPETKKCYSLGYQGPCGKNMVFYAKDNLHGTCDCKEDQRILIYHRNTNQCYYIFQQGYCQKGKWLDMSRFGKPTCRNNECFKYQKKAPIDLVKFKGTCVEVGKSATGCSEGEVVGFSDQKRSPVCVPSRVSPAAPGMRSFGVPTTPCSPGSVMAVTGTCQPPFDFD